MNTIGFKNFRRFANFPEIDLGDVTILVGGNNSGKSTVVKALLLCVDNIRLMRMNDSRRGEGRAFLYFTKPVFHFDANEYHDVKIKEFARAIHNKPVDNDNEEKPSLPTTIVFEFTLGQFHFTFHVSGDRDESSTSGVVDFIMIEDMKSHVVYTNDYKKHTMSYEVFGTDTDEQQTIVQKLKAEYKATKKAFEKANEEGDLETISQMRTKLDKIEMQLSSILDRDDVDTNILDEDMVETLAENSFKKHNPVKVRYTDLPLGIYHNKVAEPVVLNVINNILNFAITRHPMPKPVHYRSQDVYEKKMEEYAAMDEVRKNMSVEKDTIMRSYYDLSFLLEGITIEYISAHAANQNTLYNTADANDYIAQTVHNFWREKINPGDNEYEFVREWMRKFNIGANFDIKVLVPGEAYMVTIIDEDGSKVPLADKGMGSIQMMILLLRLATILNKHKPGNIKNTREYALPIIVIEEPEQNLHPKMQSYLADLFYFLAKNENCKFLIETHSEYLIRKSQVIVCGENFADGQELKENNRFKVYYLPEDGTDPYEMQYTPTGRFANKFGEGFFDEAGKSNLITLRKEKGLK